MFSKISFVLAFIATASAHMTIEHPVPFGKTTLNSSPLAPGDFPCKQRSGVYDIVEMNQWNAGETQVITFKGSAVHGGGSCQFSLTTDPEPTEKSQWKVIHSVIGGCPSNVTGNLEENPEGRGAATFPVTMPKNIPDGRYTFAWTWLNKVGNREFYMNCAPVQVGTGTGTGSSSIVSTLSSLPDMFVANLPADSCTTTSNQDFDYPEPGQSVVRGSGAQTSNKLEGLGCAKQNKMGAGNGQIGTPSQPSDTPSKPSDTPSQPKASEKPAASSAAPSYGTPKQSAAPSYGTPKQSASPSIPGGVFAPGASMVPQPSVPATKPIPSSTPDKAPDNNNTTPSKPSNGDCSPCTEDGAVVCIGSKQFGLCNRGCVVAQDLAYGMTCSNGAVVASSKRSIHFPRAHIHRRHSARLL